MEHIQKAEKTWTDLGMSCYSFDIKLGREVEGGQTFSMPAARVSVQMNANQTNTNVSVDFMSETKLSVRNVLLFACYILFKVFSLFYIPYFFSK